VKRVSKINSNIFSGDNGREDVPVCMGTQQIVIVAFICLAGFGIMMQATNMAQFVFGIDSRTPLSFKTER
jgi:hypothetical protein